MVSQFIMGWSGGLLPLLLVPLLVVAQDQYDRDATVDGARRAHQAARDRQLQADWDEWRQWNQSDPTVGQRDRPERRDSRWGERHPAWMSPTQQWGWQRPLLDRWNQPADALEDPDWALRARDWDPRGGDWRGVPWRARTRGWDPRRGDWTGTPPRQDVRNPVRVQGRLMHGVAAIGGESTGTELHFNGDRWELEFSQAPHLLHVAPRWNRQSVIVEGVVRTVRGVDIPRRTILTVHSMRPAAYRFERR